VRHRPRRLPLGRGRRTSDRDTSGVASARRASVSNLASDRDSSVPRPTGCSRPTNLTGVRQHPHILGLRRGRVFAHEAVAGPEAHQLFHRQERLISQRRVRCCNGFTSRRRGHRTGGASSSSLSCVPVIGRASLRPASRRARSRCQHSRFGTRCVKSERVRVAGWRRPGPERAASAAALAKPLVPPAVLQHVRVDLGAREAERVLNQDAEFEPHFAARRAPAIRSGR